jgi:hypothetical protein
MRHLDVHRRRRNLKDTGCEIMNRLIKGQMAGFCEQGNSTSVFKKAGHFSVKR